MEGYPPPPTRGRGIVLMFSGTPVLLRVNSEFVNFKTVYWNVYMGNIFSLFINYVTD